MLSVLTQFGQFSGYKLNLHKSELFAVNSVALAFEYTTLPFKVVQDRFTYFDITVTRKYKLLYFHSLLNQMKQRLV